MAVFCKLSVCGGTDQASRCMRVQLSCSEWQDKPCCARMLTHVCIDTVSFLHDVAVVMCVHLCHVTHPHAQQHARPCLACCLSLAIHMRCICCYFRPYTACTAHCLSGPRSELNACRSARTRPAQGCLAALCCLVPSLSLREVRSCGMTPCTSGMYQVRLLEPLKVFAASLCTHI